MNIREIVEREIVAIDNDDINSILDAINANDLQRIKEEIINLDMGEGYEYLNEELKVFAIIYAAMYEKTEILEYLLKNMDLPKELLNIALVEACGMKSEKSVGTIIKNCKGINLAHIIPNYLISVIDRDMEQGILNEDGDNIELRISKDSLDILKLLLKKGININVRDEQGYSPLQYALESKNNDMILEILKYHAYPRYNKKSLIGYVLEDLNLAQMDKEYLLNSEWYKNIEAEKKAIKEKIKSIVNYENERELGDLLKKIASEIDIANIDELTNKEDILDVACICRKYLKQRLSNVNKTLEIVDQFKERINLNTENKVLEVIDLCKKNNVKDLTFNL